LYFRILKEAIARLRNNRLEALRSWECAGARPPWYTVPAVDKENARLIVSQIVLDTLKLLHMAYPKATAKRWRELEAIRTPLSK
jgi:hypothetical protein